MIAHIVPDYTIGEKCSSCGKPASHKVAEEAPMVFDKPGQVVRHKFTTYLCCHCFSALMGSSASEACGLTPLAVDLPIVCDNCFTRRSCGDLCENCGSPNTASR